MGIVVPFLKPYVNQDGPVGGDIQYARWKKARMPLTVFGGSFFIDKPSQAALDSPFPVSVPVISLTVFLDSPSLAGLGAGLTGLDGLHTTACEVVVDLGPSHRLLRAA